MKVELGHRRWYVSWGIICLTSVFILLIIQIQYPADGFTDFDGIARGPVVAHHNVSKQEVGLQVGDIVLAINGYMIEDLREAAFTLRPPLTTLTAGIPATYTVIRQGQEQDISVVPTHLTLGQILSRAWLNIFTGGVFFAVGLLAFWRKPNTREAQIFYLTCVGISWPMFGRAVFAFQPSDLVNQTGFLIFSAIDYLSFWINLPLIFHLMLVFPNRNVLLDKVPWLLYVTYPLLMVVSMGIGLWQGYNLAGSIAIMDAIRFPFGMLYLIASVSFLIRSFITLKDRTGRNQIRWIVWGAAIGVFPWLFLYSLPQWLMGTPWMSGDVVNIFLSLVPIAFGISIIRYRLFDIETVIHRSVVFGAITLSLVVLYLIMINALTQTIRMLKLDSASPLLPIGVAVGVALFFTPIRNYLQNKIDHTFYKERVAFQKLPLEVSRELSGTVKLDDIVTLLTRTIPRRLKISSAELLLHDVTVQEWFSYRKDTGQILNMSISGSIVEYFQKQNRAIPLYDTEKIDEPVVMFFEQAVEVTIPLNIEQKLIGVYNLYAKESGDYYRTEEVAILTNLGYQVAVSLSNAQRFQQIRQLNLDLEVRAKEYEVLYKQERRRSTQLGLINEVSRETASILETDRLLDTIAQHIKDSFAYHWVSILLLTHQSQQHRQLVCVAAAGADSNGNYSPVGWRSSLTAKEIAVSVARTGEPAIIKDVQTEPGYLPLGGFLGVESELAVPLITQDGVIGVLDVASRHENAFDIDDLVTMQTLAGQIAVALENAHLVQSLTEQERLKQELLIAQKIQANLLPLDVPDVAGLKIFGRSIAAEEVGGDFYNYGVFDENRLVVAVGDVSGKGLSASLMMAVSITALRAQSPHYKSTAALLESLNNLLYPQFQANQMNTAMLCLEFDLQKREIQVSNAGLIAPMIISNHDQAIDQYTDQYLEICGLPLGVICKATYQRQTIPMRSGDLIVVCSDGIVEAMNPRKELYGFSRLAKTVEQAKGQSSSVKEIVSTVLGDVFRFMNRTPQQDDMTILAIEVE